MAWNPAYMLLIGNLLRALHIRQTHVGRVGHLAQNYLHTVMIVTVLPISFHTSFASKWCLTGCCLLQVCYYRDKQTTNKFQIAKVTKEGTHISEPFALDTQWSYKAFEEPGAGAVGTW